MQALKEKTKNVLLWLTGELQSIRTGQASPAVLDAIQIEQYGALTPIKHIAAITIEDARTLRISPWDSSALKSIESAISAQNLGISTVPDQNTLRVSFPELSGERRETLTKLVRQKLEEARVRVRKSRDEAMNELGRDKKDKKISEDEEARMKKDVQKIIDEVNVSIEKVTESKIKEISQ